jgi:cytochrome b
MKNERVWDPLVRLFHWSLVAAFATAWWGRGETVIHETAGKVVICLIIFRAVWGLIGPASARFENFIAGPKATLAYVLDILRGKPAHHIGHNPAGAAMIGLMLLTIAATAASGVLMTTTALWGNAWIEWIHGTSAYLTLLLIAAHLLGILAAAIQHHENLV